MSWTKDDYDYFVKRGLASDRSREEAQMRGGRIMIHRGHENRPGDLDLFKPSPVTKDEPGPGNKDIAPSDD